MTLKLNCEGQKKPHPTTKKVVVFTAYFLCFKKTSQNPLTFIMPLFSPFSGNRISSHYFLGGSRKNPWRIYTVLADDASWSCNVRIKILVSGNIKPLFCKCIAIGRQSVPLCYCLWPMLSLLRWASMIQFRWLNKLLSPPKSYHPKKRALSTLTLFQYQV